MRTQMFQLTHLFLCASLCIYVIGCRGKQDLMQNSDIGDPEVTLQAVETTYQPAAGAVKVSWLFSGQSDRGTFKIYRRGADETLKFVGQLQELSDAEKENGIASYVDQTIYSGEKAVYQVIWENGTGKSIYSNEAHVDIPGASIRPLKIGHASATVEVSWIPDTSVGASYEIIRQIDEEPTEVIYQSPNVNDRSFEDGSLVGNHKYTYYVQTTTSQGAVLKSRPVEMKFLSLAGSLQLFNQKVDAVYLGTSSWPTSTQPTVFLLNMAEVKRAPRYLQLSHDEVRTSAETATLDIGNLIPESIAYDGPDLRTTGQLPNQVIVGIHSETKELEIHFHQMAGFGTGWALKPFFKMSESATQELNVRIAVSRNKRNQLFLLVDNVIKMFKFEVVVQGNNIFTHVQKMGQVSVDALSSPYDIFSTGHFLWVSLPDEGRLLKGRVHIDEETLTGIDWQDVHFPAGVRPGALTVNTSNQVFALDATNKKIWVINPEGEVVTYIENLGTRFEQNGLAGGDLLMGLEDGQNVLYLAKPSGTIQYYVTE